MKVIIVEDEELARDLLKDYLAKEQDVEVLGEYGDGFSAAVGINKHKPDVIFLDIQLPRLNGFEMLEVLDYTPQIIFSTAYDDYAISAFEQNATDYLLKPYSKERLFAALAKARERMSQGENSEKNAGELASDLTQQMPLDRIVVKDSKGINVIPTNDVHYIEAQDDYIMIHSKQGRYLKKQTMKSVMRRLNPDLFVRVHRSFILNVLEIARIEPYGKDTYIAILKSGAKVNLSENGYKALREKLEF
ncbi:MAG: LytR/AlgR family response regulator transcription factor [Bacteroidales bacterium]